MTTRKPFPVFDGDSHVVEPPELWEKYLEPERDRCLSALDEHLGKRPRYFSLANGQYSKSVMRQLLNSFEKVSPFR